MEPIESLLIFTLILIVIIMIRILEKFSREFCNYRNGGIEFDEALMYTIILGITMVSILIFFFQDYIQIIITK